MKDIDKDLKHLFGDVKEEYNYDYKLENTIVNVISRPKDYDAKLRKSRMRRKFGIVGTCILLPIYLWLLMNYNPAGDEFKITVLACVIVIVVVGILYSVTRGGGKLSSATTKIM